MKAYFTFTETSLRRRPSLFPGTRSPSATLGLPFPTPSTEHAPRASVPAHHRHAPTSRRSPSSQSLSHQPILPGNIRDRPRLLNDLPDGYFSKFRRELPTFAWHYSFRSVHPILLGPTVRNE